jgi:hypothetical protein
MLRQDAQVLEALISRELFLSAPRSGGGGGGAGGFVTVMRLADNGGSEK